MPRFHTIASPTLILLLGGGLALVHCSGGDLHGIRSPATGEDGGVQPCVGGEDNDGDGYGRDCPAGEDCDDSNADVFPGAVELCDGIDNDCDDELDEGARNDCGTCTTGCDQLGQDPLPVSRAEDPAVQRADDILRDDNGDLVLAPAARTTSNFIWIANANDIWHDSLEPFKETSDAGRGRGTVSKIDTVQLKEVARYFTVTCRSRPGAPGCVDYHGQPIRRIFHHWPSRTAVDYNFDVWVANRAFGGQPSATKIANDRADCIDRNGNGLLDTSRDRDGSGHIETDCDGDGRPDHAATVCRGGGPPEFYGDDDECVLLTVNFAEVGDIGRSVCLDPGIDRAPGNAWVGTNNHQPTNRFYKIDGLNYQVSGPYDLGEGHRPYGCVVDSEKILWSTSGNGTLTYLNTIAPTQVGEILASPWEESKFYGISLDPQRDIWLGGSNSGRIYRYHPDRTSLATLGQGSWTGVTQPDEFERHPGTVSLRGIAADNRGKVWVAVNNGFVWRVEQNLAHGVLHDLSADADFWRTSGTTVIGVGIDFTGHVWGIAYSGNVASRLQVDASGNVIDPTSMQRETVPVGLNPYTYSDFTGFGLRHFTRPTGRYVYRLAPCDGEPASLRQVSWEARTPPGTSLRLRLRGGEGAETMGGWLGPFVTSPAEIGPQSAEPLTPNPASLLELEFTFEAADVETSPVLEGFSVSYFCKPPD